MKPIFISYSSKHRALTRELAAAIEAQYGPGSVWWDHDLESRASFSARNEVEARPIRLVLLTRSAGEWWTTLHDESPEVQRVFRGGRSGPPLAGSG